jgi:hypothetical protein
VPFVPTTGTNRFLDIGPTSTSHGLTGTPRIQIFFDRPAFGATGESWEGLAGLITNFTHTLGIFIRVMHGLLGYDSGVCDSIKAANPFALALNLAQSPVSCFIMFQQPRGIQELEYL